MRGATFDSSFWVHTVYLELVDFLLEDYELYCTRAVEKELGQSNPTSLCLKSLLTDKTIQPASPRSTKIKLYGDGERAAMNLALERELILLIDDWRPYEAAQVAGVEVVNTCAYLTQLYGQRRISLERALSCLSQLVRRNTLRPVWTQAALKVIAELRKEGQKQ